MGIAVSMVVRERNVDLTTVVGYVVNVKTRRSVLKAGACPNMDVWQQICLDALIVPVNSACARKTLIAVAGSGTRSV